MTQLYAGVFWFTGLSGSGKTTLCRAVADRLTAMKQSCLVLDGDLVREGLCADLGYAIEDRFENIRRAEEVARLAVRQNLFCLCAFITPYTKMRERLRQRLGPLYHEIYLCCPLDVCMERDPKHNYQKAKQGLLTSYTGLDAPYEAPTAPDLCVETNLLPMEECVQRIVEYVLQAAVHSPRLRHTD